MIPKTITYDELLTVCRQKLCQVGVDEDQANTVATCYATADLYGVYSHGAAILPAHIKRIQGGGYNLTPRMRIERESAAFAVINSDNALGAVSAHFCTMKAIEIAKRSGIGIVFTHHANTYGPAFVYPLMMSQERLLGITCCNSPAAMPAPNGKEKLLGTNPFSVVTPTKSGDPIIYDIATSIVAKSKINQIRQQGGVIPEGWALDKTGQPTTDPATAIEGLLLPMAGFKGYGLAMVIDLLSGLLSGASYLNDVKRFYTDNYSCMDVGQFFMAIDPVAVLGEVFYEMMDGYVATLRNSEKIDSTHPIALPGDDRMQNYHANQQNGIPISEELFEFLTH